MKRFLGPSARAISAFALAIACSSGDDGANNGGARDGGPTTPGVCGNGILDVGEACDDRLGLGNRTCATETMGSLDRGTLRCTACVVDFSGCSYDVGPVITPNGGTSANGGTGNPNPPGTGGMGGPGGTFGAGGAAGPGGSLGAGGTLGAGGSNGSTGEAGRMTGFTAAHNQVRSDVPTPTPLPPLTWSPQIAAVAQAYADRLASQGCPLVHSGTPGYGENLAWFSGQQGNAQQVVEMWAGELACYTFGTIGGTEQCSGACGASGCGHYTQIVWRGTTEVGCGMATCPGEEIWVCNYSPPGNFIGRTPY